MLLQERSHAASFGQVKQMYRPNDVDMPYCSPYYPLERRRKQAMHGSAVNVSSSAASTGRLSFVACNTTAGKISDSTS